MNDQNKYYFYGLFAMAVFALVPIVVKVVHMDYVTLSITRLILATAGIVFMARKEFAQLGFKAAMNLKLIALFGFFFALHWLTYFYAIKISSAALITVAFSIYGIFILVLGKVLLGTRPSLFDYAIVFFGILGTFLVVPEFNITSNMTIGFIFGLISCFAYAVVNVLHQKFSKIDTNIRAFYQFFGAMCVSLLFIPMANFTYTQMDILGLIYLTLGASLCGHVLWAHVSTNLPTTKISLIFYIEIPMSLTLSYLLIDEKLSQQQLLGCAIIIIANLTGVYVKEFRKNRQLQKST